jgi:putative ABC transport system permease protein
MFWAGAALLSWRLADLLLSRGRTVLARLRRPLADPPPEHLAVPWAYLGIVAGIAILGLVLAALAAIRAARRPPLTVLREL